MAVRRRRIWRIGALLALFLLCGYGFLRQNTFSYTNLADPDSRAYARTLLAEAAVPGESIEQLLGLIEDFYQVPYPGLAAEGFRTGCIPFFSYRDADAIAHFEQQGSTLICRTAAFLLLGDSVAFLYEIPEDLEEKDGSSRRFLADRETLRRYDLLFANLTGREARSSYALAEAVADYWREAGVRFPEEAEVMLLTAWGSDGELIQNFHTGVVLRREDGLWLLEKYDPMYPYQLSRFRTEEQLARYMGRRVSQAKYGAVLLGDRCLWTK